METEIWKDIVGYEGLYKVSNLGKVISVNYHRQGISKELKLQNNSHGYISVFIYKCKLGKNIQIHRLVAQAFIINPDNKPQVNHINGIKTDNRVENLEWCTHSENIKHSYRVLLQKPTKYWEGRFGENNFKNVSVLQLTLDGRIIKEWDGMQNITRNIGVSYQNIWKCCKNIRKTAGGFMWKYKLPPN